MDTNYYSDLGPEPDFELPYYDYEHEFADYSQIADYESEYAPSIEASDRVEKLTKNIREYERKGWRVLNAPPVRNKKNRQFEAQKGPRAKNWTTDPPSHDEVIGSLVGYQEGIPENLVLLTGAISNNLVAIDIDSEEAWVAFCSLLEEVPAFKTAMVRTRPSAPYRAHFFYLADEPIKSVQYNHPASEESSRTTHVEILAEKRCAVVPPSIHPDANDEFQWNKDSIADLAPTSISSKKLDSFVRYVAGAAMLGREWRKLEGSRQETALALAGTLARAGWEQSRTMQFLGVVAIVGQDDEVDKRLSVVDQTYKVLEDGGPATGLPRLRTLLSESVVKNLVSWLELKEPMETAVEPTAEEWQPKDIRLVLTTEPPEVQWIFKDLMPRGIVAGLAAAGGTGKSMLMLELAVSAATGKVLLPFFTPSAPMRVMLFLGEDPEDVQARRLHLVNRWAKLTENELELLYRNLFHYPYPGEPLIAQGKTGEATTQRYSWMKDEFGKISPDLVMLDPRSRWVSLDENNNDHATRFISLLEKLVKPSNGSILIAHHVGKSNASSMTSQSPRGASAFSDGVRLLINMATVNEGKGSPTSGEAGDQFVTLQVSKSNYSAKTTRQVRLRQKPEWEGILEEDSEGSRTFAILNAIIEELRSIGAINASGINDPHKECDKKFVQAVNEQINHTVSERKVAIMYGLTHGLLRTWSEKTGGKPAQKIGLPEPDLDVEEVIEPIEDICADYDF